jgi:hypothetical protein
MAIKKAFIELHALLTASEEKKVKTVMPQVLELMESRGGGGAASSIHKDAEGNVVLVHDYYFKKWLPVEFVEFGSKANSASGLNTMCKLGTSLWTKQQREFKKGKEALLEAVAAGDVLPTEIQAKLDELEEARGYIAEYPIPELAFDSVEEYEAADLDVMAQALVDYEAAQAEAETEAAEAEAEAA